MALNPHEPQTLLRAALVAHEQRDYDAALPLYKAVLAVEPDDPVALHNLGAIHLDRIELEEAERPLRRLFEAQGLKDLGPVNSLATVLLRQRRIKEAIALLHQANEADPDDLDILINLSAAYLNLDQPDGALHYAFEALKRDITSKYAFNNLGSAYGAMAKFEEARIAFETAIDLDPGFLEAVINYGGLEFRSNNHSNAIAIYENALARLPAHLKPQEGLIRYYLAYSYLRLGRMKEGWDNYEHGFHPLILKSSARSPNRKIPEPTWQGESLMSKRLLVWREQGLGDEIMFMSCFKDLVPDHSRVIIECDRRMVAPFQRSFPTALVREQVADGTLNAIHSDFDYHLPMASMMRFTRKSIADFDRSGPYIVPDPAKVDEFRARLATVAGGKTTIGICWRSGKMDAVRSLGYSTLEDWAPLFAMEDVAFVNLQYGRCEDELRASEEAFGITIHRWPDLNLRDDLDDVFALMRALDVTVTAATAVHSMSAAVGTRTIMFGKENNWTCFGLDHNPWYPNLTMVLRPSGETVKAFPAIRELIEAERHAARGHAKMEAAQ